MGARSKTVRKVGAVDKALAILFVLAQNSQDWGVSELARALHESPSVVHSLLRTLYERGVVDQNPATRKYYLGLGAVEIGQAALKRLAVLEQGREPLRALAHTVGECAYLMVRAQRSVVLIDRADPPVGAHVAMQVGMTSPLHAGATSKALMAFLPPEEIAAYLQEGPLEAAGPRTVTDPDTLLRDLAQIRADGFAYTEEEVHDGLAAVAAPIFNHTGRVVAGVGVAGLIERVRGRKYEIAQAVRATARSISQYLGAPRSG
ncbi:IclR family transcriptional regulator [Caldinitratiruptor microaerophilus]|uniref:IclR family transcriptional regulator n=1 Tax=Caldinitratiruptor microaerophilus TaxID=671077 RepID=A0AA35G872_9FIRM|nr:IclR family transcriptional regulator [Caldinitratiruptor microaerophilus]BDG60123.1 IclR family transcriptional regulator [Caldinitratiruptor microaerophilus]